MLCIARMWENKNDSRKTHCVSRTIHFPHNMLRKYVISSRYCLPYKITVIFDSDKRRGTLPASFQFCCFTLEQIQVQVNLFLVNVIVLITGALFFNLLITSTIYLVNYLVLESFVCVYIRKTFYSCIS